MYIVDVILWPTSEDRLFEFEVHRCGFEEQ